MGNFSKLFNTHAEYQAAESNLILPNVSFCKDTANEVHYNPYVAPDPYNGHDYVEIGGLKWATMNIGANSVTDGGLFFQWGDTQGYTASEVGSGSGQKYFGWDDYKYWTIDTSAEGDVYKNGKITKYNSIDGKTVLDASDDAATANWGGSWRLPTIAEFQTLSSATTSAWTSNYEGSGVSGVVLTDKTDSTKTLFFPAVGLCYDGSVRNADSIGYYWSSSRYDLRKQSAYIFDFDGGGVYCQHSNSRNYGKTVRGIVG